MVLWMGYIMHFVARIVSSQSDRFRWGYHGRMVAACLLKGLRVIRRLFGWRMERLRDRKIVPMIFHVDK